jgi:uncharacterized protein YcgI (DUF1989 family)
MARRVVEEFIIPKQEARAFIVPKGQILRISLVEGRQVGDCVFYNADDHKEIFHCGQSWALNGVGGTGTSKAFKYFYSKPPRENVMLTTLEDTVKNHWGNMGGRCSRRWYETKVGQPDHPNCQDNLSRALEPFGLTGDDIFDIFNVFMNVELGTDGSFTLTAPTTKAGDHIDLRAEMNVLAAISACPSDNSPTNDFRAKPLGVKIFADE